MTTPTILEDKIKNGEARKVKTDTVPAYVARAVDRKGVLKIFELKKRPLDKNLPVFGANLAQVATLGRLDFDDQPLMKELLKFWPGQLTVILPRVIEGEPYLGDGPQDTIAMRIPDDDYIYRLCVLNGPLAQSSANLSGEPTSGEPSTIISLVNGFKLIREGAISAKRLTGFEKLVG